MITRAQYIADSANLHQAYYAEVAADLGIKITDEQLISRVKEALANGDTNLNTIRLQIWDVMALSLGPRLGKERHAKLKARGESWSLGTGVCVFKAAARVAAEGV